LKSAEFMAFELYSSEAKHVDSLLKFCGFSFNNDFVVQVCLNCGVAMPHTAAPANGATALHDLFALTDETNPQRTRLTRRNHHRHSPCHDPE
jgi:hypothetical protein